VNHLGLSFTFDGQDILRHVLGDDVGDGEAVRGLHHGRRHVDARVGACVNRESSGNDHRGSKRKGNQKTNGHSGRKLIIIRDLSHFNLNMAKSNAKSGSLLF